MKINHGFRRAVMASAILHTALLVLLLISPSLPRPAKKGPVYYLPLNLVGPSGGGGGGGGGGGPSAAAQKVSTKPASLRDLTTPQKKTTTQTESALRYPVEKKKTAKKVPEKKTVISKPEAETGSSSTGEGTTTATGGGFGAGIRIGVGPGPGSGTGGGWGGGDFGLASFPYTYYLQIIQDKVSANWFTSLIDPGVAGQFQCVVFFKILRDGRVVDLQIEYSSGIKSLDLSALRAVQNATPFPPLPREFEGDSLGIHLIFEHRR